LAGGSGTETDAGGSGDMALLNNPSGIAFDDIGNLYIADNSNNVLRMFDVATGVMTTLAGSGSAANVDGIGTAASFNGPNGLAYDGHGHLFVTDSDVVIREVDLASGMVTTVAGTSNQGGCSLGTGAAARFNGLGSPASDRNGHLFVAVTFCFSVVEFDTATWAETLVAGSNDTNAICAYADGIGAAAQFSYAGSVTYDGAGNLYVIDSGAPFCGNTGNTLRRINVASQAVTTLAGVAGQSGSTDGVGAAARFNQPGSLQFVPLGSTAAGSIYVDDGLNDTLRRVDLATNAVTTVAGAVGQPGTADGPALSARIQSVGSFAFDGASALFFDDPTESTVRRFDLAADRIVTVSGAAAVPSLRDSNIGTARFNSPVGTAFDGSTFLYVSDTGTNTIQRVNVATGDVNLYAGTGAATNVDGPVAAAAFDGPNHMTYDGSRYLYVAQADDVIRQIDLVNNTVATVAGTHNDGNCASTGVGPTATFNALGDMVADGQGHLYVTDVFCFSVIELDTTTWQQSVLAGSNNTNSICAYGDGPALSASFSYASGIASDGQGHLYLADSGAGFCSGSGHTIRKVDLATNTVTTIAGAAGQRGSTDGLGTAARFNAPATLAFVPNVGGPGPGTLFVADTGNDTVREIDLSTFQVTTPIGIAGVTTLATGLLPGGLDNPPQEMAVGPGPSLLLSDSSSNLVLLAR
jgi:sugar lactone lactonase YvrE